MDMVACATDRFEQVGEFFITAHQQFYPVIVGQRSAHVFQAVHNDAVAWGSLGSGMSSQE